MKRDTTYWRRQLVFDDLWDAYGSLNALEMTTVGEPKHYPFHNAADKLFMLIVELQEQLDAAGRNSYYQSKQKD
jgi:hypothetical protein